MRAVLASVVLGLVVMGACRTDESGTQEPSSGLAGGTGGSGGSFAVASSSTVSGSGASVSSAQSSSSAQSGPGGAGGAGGVGGTGGAGGTGGVGGVGGVLAGGGGTGGVAGGCPGSEIVINELRYDLPGADGDLEWIELYNSGNQMVDIGGWEIKGGTSALGQLFVFDSGTMIASQDYVVVGGAGVAGADFNHAGNLTFGNGSNADIVQLTDGTDPVDTVIYGEAGDNSDMWEDDCGNVPAVYAPDTTDQQSLARSPNGVDSNDCEADFIATDSITMGMVNP